MLKFGNASAQTRVTVPLGSISRARSAALTPASLPPMMTSRFTRLLRGNPPPASALDQ